MKYARIESGIVAELLETDGDISAMFHPLIQWVAADASAAVGDSYSGGKFSKPAAPAPTIEQVKAAKLVELASACTQHMATIKAGYPQDEISTWDKQESEARAYTASNTAATPLLSALATARGIALADLAARVISKADAFAAASGAIIGKRQKYEDQVSAAADSATVAAIVWTD